jgi:RHS repeat-associated protein
MRKSKQTGIATVTTHIWINDQIALDKTGSDVVSYIHGIRLIVSSAYGWYHFNGRTDVVQLTNSTGIVTRRYDYDPFGNQLGTISSTDNNPYRYCGEYYDTESGYTYLRARYYDPKIGRFINEDPIFDGDNWYRYANNNPIMYIDPSGLIAVRIVGAFVGGVIAGTIELIAQSFLYFLNNYPSLRGFRINGWKLGWEIAWGAVAGALIPTRLTRGGMAVGSAIINTVKGVAERMMRRQSFSFTSVVQDLVVGALSGLAAGPGLGRLVPNGGFRNGGVIYYAGRGAQRNIPLNATTFKVFAREFTNTVLGSVVTAVGGRVKW